MITLIVGPMFSGKSTMLLTYERRFNIIKKNVITINHSFDTRYSSECKITTHNLLSSSCINHITAGSNTELDKYNDLFETMDVIIIDEVQFFSGISEFVNKWALKGKYIVCAGLNSDYKMDPFPYMSSLFSVADKIIHLCSTCSKCGEDAPFTQRLTEDKTVNVVGGIDTYEPRCRKCFVNK